MRQRNRRQPRAAAGKESRDRWMITYADLITLLLIFFVILYAMSSLDSQKYAIVSGSLSDTFKSGSAVLEGGSGVLEGNQGITGAGVSKAHNEDGGDADAPSATDSADADGLNGTGQTGDGAGHQPSARELAFREQEAKLAALMGVITEYVEENNLGEQIFVADKPQGIAITLSDRFLFDAGKAELKSPAFLHCASSPAYSAVSALPSASKATPTMFP